MVEIKKEKRKHFKPGQKVIVTCDNPMSGSPTFGGGNGYPGKGWTGRIIDDTSYADRFQWSIKWDKKFARLAGSGDLVWEWQIDEMEWDTEENK